MGTPFALRLSAGVVIKSEIRVLALLAIFQMYLHTYSTHKSVSNEGVAAALKRWFNNRSFNCQKYTQVYKFTTVYIT